MSAATAAALPTLDIGIFCLAGAQVMTIEGILNGTTNYILTRMHTEKCAYEIALKEAQQMGIAETNPKLDVDGWDSCNKLVLISNRVLGTDLSPKDVEVTGIAGVTIEDLEEAMGSGKVQAGCCAWGHSGQVGGEIVSDEVGLGKGVGDHGFPPLVSSPQGPVAARCVLGQQDGQSLHASP